MAKRILGIDFGLKRIGLAQSDEMHILASPIKTMEAHRQMATTVERVLEVINSGDYGEIVVGMPFQLDGKMGFLADEAMHFITLLREKLDIPVTEWDERYTSLQAERTLREAGMNRKKRKGVVDKLAAVIILQNYLDYRSNS